MFNGNVLYADDHVEEWNNHAFPAFKYDPHSTYDVFCDGEVRTMREIHAKCVKTHAQEN